MLNWFVQHPIEAREEMGFGKAKAGLLDSCKRAEFRGGRRRRLILGGLKKEYIPCVHRILDQPGEMRRIVREGDGDFSAVAALARCNLAALEGLSCLVNHTMEGKEVNIPKAIERFFEKKGLAELGEEDMLAMYETAACMGEEGEKAREYYDSLKEDERVELANSLILGVREIIEAAFIWRITDFRLRAEDWDEQALRLIKRHFGSDDNGYKEVFRMSKNLNYHKI